jgi:hypothetical protein
MHCPGSASVLAVMRQYEALRGDCVAGSIWLSYGSYVGRGANWVITRYIYHGN